jgi:hypothetical protein
MDVVGVKFVWKIDSAPNALTSFTPSFLSGVSGLDHETLDIAMKGCPIVCTTGGQCQEVEGRSWCRVAVDFEL